MVENYFNYFTEVEECFRRCRHTPSLLSTLDWALIESWKEAGIPLEAVLVGIERAFEKSQRRTRRTRKVNSLAYCTPEVLRAAEEARGLPAEASAQAGSLDHRRGEAALKPDFTGEDIRAYCERNGAALEAAARMAEENGQRVLAEDLARADGSLAELGARVSGDSSTDLQDLERHFSAVEEQLTGSLLRATSVELLTELRREVERGVTPYRRKMTALQVESLERQFLKRSLFEHYRIPRLSLFYFE